VLVIASVTVVPRFGFAQSTADELAAAREQLDELDREAQQLADQYADAYARSSEVGQQIVEIDARRARVASDQRTQRDAASARAVQLYVQGSDASVTPLLLASGSAMDAARRDHFASLIADRDRQTLDGLRAIGQDLDALRDELQAAKADEDALAAQLERDSAALDAKLRETQRLRDKLADQLAVEQEAARRAAEARARAEAEAAARAAAEAAARADAADSNDDSELPDSSDDGSGGEDSGGSSGSTYGVTICPIDGAVAFSDTWGDARPGGRWHQGVDLLSPAGTPNVAVVSGRIEHDYGDRMGNAIFLYGDNGNTYYYFHLSAFEGEPRNVAQGEVIGYVGSTGSSGANHTHFEIHPGGGSAVNPYPAVAQVC
jgi:septal ring factor EnvC (AmiA/AmiB activator)